MRKTSFLYGIEPGELVSMHYLNALKYKLDNGTRLYRKLFLNSQRTHDEDVRLFEVEKALKHTRKLIEEME